jgi:hypothetical protein
MVEINPHKSEHESRLNLQSIILMAMKTIWQKSVAKIIIWLAAEILLTAIGLDDLADYSEFIFEKNVITIKS